MELRILSGLHRGAIMEMDEFGDAVALGSSPGGDHDVLLADTGIARRHCLMKPGDGDHWTLEPLQGKVFDAQARELAGPANMERGQAFRVGDVWFGMFDSSDPWREPPTTTTNANAAAAPASAAAAPAREKSSAATGRYPRVKAPIIVAVLCAFLLPVVWFAATARGTVTAVEEQATAARIAAAPQLPASPAKLAEEFTRALVERELRDRLDLQLSPDHWEIRGSLDADERQRFERMLVRFTETRKPTFPIKVSLLTPAELLPFKVVEVITGKGASIVTDAGERIPVGDTHQGWKLVSVEAGKVAFQGRQRVEVTL